ncbi:MAG: hypothetical protein C4520_03615 [Candidatus Abyssobacteria bacterium SURF_5]|uniref:Uncharacterized protein n=1 Tax=Abyssobacteria bacterium (strain SURF_5) TaxID=2093360 RepID=A0A3A4P9M6_ABYX5|nr:MAG: hypothetical protein C4520_03615 [Candidatus Abyssubacteria bacterium SURF_5]
MYFLLFFFDSAAAERHKTSRLAGQDGGKDFLCEYYTIDSTAEPPFGRAEFIRPVLNVRINSHLP